MGRPPRAARHRLTGAVAMPYILVADDDASIRDTVSWLLREHGYEVRAVEDAPGVFAALEERTPDLLLLDIMMPEMDGFQALERIKGDERWRDVPVLMFSAMPAEEATIRTLGLGSRTRGCATACWSSTGIRRSARRSTAGGRC